VAGERWFAVGDAAGYVEPFTGEGMAWAIGSGVAVAPLVEAAARRWDESLTGEWERKYSRGVGRRQWACQAVAAGLRSPTLTRLAVRVLSAVPAMAAPVVRSLNRPTRESPA
jgi:flavin-dependent dehydrogenase